MKLTELRPAKGAKRYALAERQGNAARIRRRADAPSEKTPQTRVP
jgi:hypothetical protein